MRILLVITWTDRRGPQVFATHLADALGERGHEVRTVALVPGTGERLLPVPALGTSRRDHRLWTGLRRELRHSDAAVALGSTTLPACALASIGTGTPFVYRQVSDSVVWSPTRGRRARTRLWLGRAAHVVALSEHNRAQMLSHLGVPAERLTVIPNGRPVDGLHPTGPADRAAARRRLGLADRPTILWIGALAWEKAPALAVEASATVAEAQLVVVGRGPEEADLRHRADRVAPGRVHFLGPVDDLGGVLAAADLVLLTSRSEAMPGVLIEAGLAGLPTVATRVGAVAEVVADGETGLLVPPDDLDRTAQAIRQVLTDPQLADRLGTAARARCAQRFDITVVARRWEEILTAAVAAS